MFTSNLCHDKLRHLGMLAKVGQPKINVVLTGWLTLTVIGRKKRKRIWAISLPDIR